MDYASRENANVASRPQLVLSLLGTPLTVSGHFRPHDFAERFHRPDCVHAHARITNATFSIAGSSSNPGLVAGTNIVFGGSGTNLTVTVTPLANQNGIALITVP